MPELIIKPTASEIMISGFEAIRDRSIEERDTLLVKLRQAIIDQAGFVYDVPALLGLYDVWRHAQPVVVCSWR